MKQNNMREILESEKLMVEHAAERYGEHFINAAEFNRLLQGFIKSISADRIALAIFLSQMKKHHTLALFSAVRLHHVQAMMDMRQVLEAGACAAYAIAHTDLKDFADTDEDGILDPSQDLAKKRYRWLDASYPKSSKAIKNMKSMINASSAHANIVAGHQNFRVGDDVPQYQTPFFDIEDEYLVKTDLYVVSNSCLGLLELFHIVNETHRGFVTTDGFLPGLKTLAAQNMRLRAEMMQSEAYQRGQRLIEQREKRKG